ncbi:MAG TPA: DUF502 domain-containing protein [Dehalococcoidales bacterium]|nr:DUF502 domain-containing protein [Dehalococcoidales bacterium]
MAEVQKRSRWSRFLRKFRDILIAGLVVTVPIGLTIWIFAWLFTQIDQLLRPLVKLVFGREIVGVGFGVILIIVLIIGAIATNNLGKRIIRWGESLLGKIPITRTIYDGIRQIIQSFSDPDKTGFMQVVMVQYPRKGVYTIGFVTNEHVDEAGKKLVNVFVPNSPNPMTGFLHIFDDVDVIRTSITIEEGLKMVVSAGRMSPKDVGDKMVQAKNDNTEKTLQAESN